MLRLQQPLEVPGRWFPDAAGFHPDGRVLVLAGQLYFQGGRHQGPGGDEARGHHAGVHRQPVRGRCRRSREALFRRMVGHHPRGDEAGWGAGHRDRYVQLPGLEPVRRAVDHPGAEYEICRGTVSGGCRGRKRAGHPASGRGTGPHRRSPGLADGGGRFPHLDLEDPRRCSGRPEDACSVHRALAHLGKRRGAVDAGPAFPGREGTGVIRLRPAQYGPECRIQAPGAVGGKPCGNPGRNL